MDTNETNSADAANASRAKTSESVVDSEPERDETPREADDRASEAMADHAAAADMDMAHDQAAPGEHATGDAAEAAQAGGAIDWSRAGKGGGFEDGDDFEGRP